MTKSGLTVALFRISYHNRRKKSTLHSLEQTTHSPRYLKMLKAIPSLLLAIQSLFGRDTLDF